MSKQELIDSMTDEELYSKAVDAYHAVKHPSENLSFLYEVWLDKNRFAKHKVRRVHSETIYKLSLFEKDSLGEEAW